jgi:uncharacterized membrane protein
MVKWAIAYAATLVIFLGLDSIFLSQVGPHLYRPEIGPLLADQVRLAPALAFYVLYIAGLVYFAVSAGLVGGWTKALINGAMLGLVAYGTYDLTCYAVMKVWTFKVTSLDLAWGVVASGLASAGAAAATRALTKKAVG